MTASTTSGWMTSDLGPRTSAWTTNSVLASLSVGRGGGERAHDGKKDLKVVGVRKSVAGEVILADKVIILAEEVVILAEEVVILADEVVILADEVVILADEVVILADEVVILAVHQVGPSNGSTQWVQIFEWVGPKLQSNGSAKNLDPPATHLEMNGGAEILRIVTL